MNEMSIPFSQVSASRYAGSLHGAVRKREPDRLADLLLVGALIEARSCERFAALVPHLPDKLGKFYAGLLNSEARHFEHYLALARSECQLDEGALNDRLEAFKVLEAELISTPDDQFRFHSGIPAI